MQSSHQMLSADSGFEQPRRSRNYTGRMHVIPLRLLSLQPARLRRITAFQNPPDDPDKAEPLVVGKIAAEWLGHLVGKSAVALESFAARHHRPGQDADPRSHELKTAADGTLIAVLTPVTAFDAPCDKLHSARSLCTVKLTPPS
jgi:hypothetical protein